MALEFSVPGNPQGKGRPRFARRGNYVSTYTPDKTKDYESFIRNRFLQAGGKCSIYPIAIAIEVCHSIPKSTSKKRRKEMLECGAIPQKKPDVDNIAKAVLDALNGVAYQDDCQVAFLLVKKKFTSSEEGCLNITIREVLP